jgi:hypothetical protein
VDIHLALAESTWKAGDKKASVTHYDAALVACVADGDKSKEGMVCMGKGFALLDGAAAEPGDASEALVALERCRELALEGGQTAQANFVTTMIDQARNRDEREKADAFEASKVASLAFADSVVKRAPIVLAMKGSPQRPQCGFSKRVAQALKKLRIKFDYFDISSDST